MNSPLDETLLTEYLDQICAEFSDLPAAWQADQREELEAHLRAMAIACSEFGSEPDLALREALKQFGEPAQVGREMARRYWPSDIRSNSFLRALMTASVWLISLFGTACLAHILWGYWLLNMRAGSHNLSVDIWQTVGYLIVFLPAVISGCMTGLATPKHSVLAMLVAVLLFFAALGCIGNGYAGPMVRNCVADMLLGGFAAHLVSRWMLGKKSVMLRLISFWQEASL